MKKILITTGLACAVALASQGQGLVIFSSGTQNISTNNSAGLITTQAAASGRTAGAGNYYYALFYSASPITSVGLFQGVDVGGNNYAFDASSGLTLVTQSYAASTATAGRFAAVNGNSDSSVGAQTIAAGSTAYFIVVGWSANLGTTLAQMEANLGTVNGYLGESASSGAITLGNAALGGSTPDSALFGSGAPFIQAFTLGAVPVPEPGTIALAAIGGASLLLLRRKK